MDEDNQRLLAELQEQNAELRQQMAALQRRHHLLHAVVEGTTDAVFVKDLRGRYLMANAAALNFAGKPIDEVLGHDDTLFFSTETAQQIMERDRRIMDSGQTQTAEEVGTAAGQTRTYLSTKGPYRDEQGRVIGLIGISRDVTGQKRLEAALAGNEARFRAIVERGGDAFFLLDATGAVIFDTPATDYNLGYSEYDNLGRSAFEMVHPDDQQFVRSQFARLMQEPNQDVHSQFRALHRNGSWRWVDVVARNRLADPNLQGIVVNYRDITDRRRAEDESQRFARILDDSLNEIYIFDAESLGFVRVNVGAQRNLGYTMEELRQLTPLDLKPEFSRKSFEALIEPLRAGWKGRTVFQTAHRRKDGSTYPVEVHLQLANGNESPVFVAIIQDITERLRAEHAVRDNEARLMGLINAAMDGIITIDENQNVVLFNPAAETIFRCSRAEVIGKSIHQFIPERFLATHDQRVRQFANSGTSIRQMGERSQVTGLRRDGTEFPAEAAILKVQVGDRWYFTVILRDISERKRSEVALRESEGRLRLFVQMSNIGFWDWNLTTNQVYFSPEWKRQLGYADDELPNCHEEWESRLHPDDLVLALAAVSDFRTGRRDNYDIEFRLRHKDGSWRWILARADMIHGDDGLPIRMMGCHVDITERKQNEQALCDAERQLRRVLNTLPAMVGILAPDGTVLGGNLLASEVFGVPVEEALGQPFADIYPWRSSPALQSQLRAALQRAAGGDTVRYDAELPSRSGPTIVADVWISPLKDEAGRVTHLITSGIDITDRKRMEMALQESAASLAAAQERAKMGSWELDLSTQSGWWSHGMFRLFDRDAALGPPTFSEFLELVHPDDRQPLIDSQKRLIETGQNGTGDFRSNPAHGVSRFFSYGIHCLHDERGRTVRLAGTLQDITERKLADDELAESRQRLEIMSRQLIAAQESERRHLARELHDEIGQSLTGIKLNLKALQQPTLASKSSSLVDDTIAVVDQTLEQVRGLALNLRPSLLDEIGLVAALRWCLDRQSQRAGFAPQFVAEASVSGASPEINSACFRIVQESLTNIARHAKARHVRVELRQDDRELELLVRDDGIGFDIPAARNRTAHGESLGLLGMEERVRLIGGQIEIVSVPSQGTTIRVRIPLAGDSS